MDNQRWQQIDKVFQAALELDPCERVAFLDNACSDDPELRSQVESLLSSDEQEWDLLAEPAYEAVACLLAEDQPELAAGEQLGHYRVLGLLGSGGMGEVYLAEDDQLGRKVALKVLPADFVGNAARLQRFRQEARTTSALNHPNIVTVYEVSESGSRHFIATEFIEGETLRQKIKRTGLDVSEALDVAIQVASALYVAHQAGIIHRDIKPENIMLRKDGYAKVLDFGLAKLIEQQPSMADGEAPGEAKPSNSSGFLMGTVRYMSPEQARGNEVDGRSDLFSLGVVLYEMITGRRPFDGGTPEEVITSVLEEEPMPLTSCLPDLPDGLQGIISKSLSKNKEERYQSAKELLANFKDLRRRVEIFSEPRHSSSALEGDMASPRARTNFSRFFSEIGRNRSRTVIVVTGLVLVATIVLFSFTGPNKRTAAFRNLTMTKLAINGRFGSPAISPDGKSVAYGMGGAIYIKQVDADGSAQLAPPEAGRLATLTFSPDGKYLYYVRSENDYRSNALYRMSVSGGPATKILSGVHSQVSFSPDGKRFAFVREYRDRNALLIANSDGTEETELTIRSDVTPLLVREGGPAWSPDGKVIVCSCGRRVEDEVNLSFIAVSVSDGTERVISAGNWTQVNGFVWLSDGTGLLMSALKGPRIPGNAQIWHISYPSGEVRQVTNDLDSYFGPSITADSSVIAVADGYTTANMWVVPEGDPAQAKLIDSSKTLYYGLSWTPDGRIVYSQVSKQGGVNIWMRNQDGTDREQFTHDAGIHAFPSVTPDGKYIIFSSNGPRYYGIWRMDIDGRNFTQLAKLNGYIYPSLTYSPDGKWVLYSEATPPQWWRVSIDGGDSIQIPGENIVWPAISPDGKYLAYIYADAKENPESGIIITPLEGGEIIKRFPLSEPLNYFIHLTWSRDGRALIYSQTNLWSQPVDGGHPKQLTDFHGDSIAFYDYSPDGKQLVCTDITYNQQITLIKESK